MSVTLQKKGTRMHRFGVWAFAVLLTLLFIWLLGFVMTDIGRIPGPDFRTLESKYVDSNLVARKNEIERELHRLEVDISNQKQVQDILRNSTENSQRTMNQLLDLRRRNLEKSVAPTPDEQRALEESQAVFLKNQEEFQKANEQISQLVTRQKALQEEMANLEEQLAAQRKLAQEEFERLHRKHSLKLASIKLLILLPLLFVAVWMVLKKRASVYKPIFYAFAFAVFWRTAQVIHEHFPSALFKYIAVVAGIVAVLAILIYLIRMIAAPKRDWLLKQYREAYNRRICPICAYPIQFGIAASAPYSRRLASVPELSGVGGTGEDTPYTCPSCGQALFSACEACGKIRHVLLPFCRHCGASVPQQS
ncbi:MAG TPA: hypothetical protein PKY35_11230 [Candidatus Hydrogenedentes bacterium]|nr:hypothetical protein [Candidatus Hydrogenedentota bacterium]HOL77590.1 hypothetical protein [Candidatus Hydrogenedentota bacterium]HPO86715.1 hypothetical protein [Candidatus Hydrogenedentota bacterium]